MNYLIVSWTTRSCIINYTWLCIIIYTIVYYGFFKTIVYHELTIVHHKLHDHVSFFKRSCIISYTIIDTRSRIMIVLKKNYIVRVWLMLILPTWLCIISYMITYHDHLEEKLHEGVWLINRMLTRRFFVFSIVGLSASYVFKIILLK